jgi:peptidoglycan/LPS O-acetylase OafA/YrhL
MNSIPYRVCMFVFYGCYTVPLFCAVSGFLAVQKGIEKGWEFVLAVLNRFLRFELPLLFVFAAVMFLNRRGLFASGDLLAQKLVNKQLAGNFAFESHYTWLFRKPFWALFPYDEPLWMIGSLFAGNIALYCFGYASSLCRRHLTGRRCTAVQAAVLMLILFIARHNIPLLAVILGGCYALVRRACSTGGKLAAVQPKLRLAALAAGVPLLLLNLWLYFIRDFDFEHFPRCYEWTGLATALALLHLAFSCRALQGCLERKPFTLAGSLSFAVYVVHYPLIGLLSCPMIYALWDRVPYVPLVLLAFAATAAACLMLAFAYNRLVERPCYYAIRKLVDFLKEN